MVTCKNLRILPVVLIAFVLGASAGAQLPNIISYQGRLTDEVGQAVTGTKLIKFNIYGSESGGDSLWSSGYQVVQIDNGLFKYELGSNVPFPDDLFMTDDPRYLGITIDTDAELDPRAEFISVPYAIHALQADSVAGSRYVKRTGDTVTGSLYFDNNGMGKGAELLLYTGAGIMNFYEGTAKRITLESEFGTFVLRQADGDLSVWLSGGEDVEEGGSIRLYNSDGASQLYLDGDRTGDGSVMLTDGSINANEMLNEPGIAFNSLDEAHEITTSTMVDLVTVSITVPAPGYVHVTGKVVIYRMDSSPAVGCNCGAYVQIDTAYGGSDTAPYNSFVYGWVDKQVATTPFVERTFYISSAGTHQFRLEGSKYSTSADCMVLYSYPSITAVYYPTSYMAK